MHISCACVFLEHGRLPRDHREPQVACRSTQGMGLLDNLVPLPGDESRLRRQQDCLALARQSEQQGPVCGPVAAQSRQRALDVDPLDSGKKIASWPVDRKLRGDPP